MNDIGHRIIEVLIPEVVEAVFFIAIFVLLLVLGLRHLVRPLLIVWGGTATITALIITVRIKGKNPLPYKQRKPLIQQNAGIDTKKKSSKAIKTKFGKWRLKKGSAYRIKPDIPTWKRLYIETEQNYNYGWSYLRCTYTQDMLNETTEKELDKFNDTKYAWGFLTKGKNAAGEI